MFLLSSSNADEEDHEAVDSLEVMPLLLADFCAGCRRCTDYCGRAGNRPFLRKTVAGWVR